MIPVSIKNLSSNNIVVPLFDEQVNTNADFTEGYITTDKGFYAEKYKGITGWNKNTNNKLYFKKRNGFLYFYLTQADRSTNINPVAYMLVNSYVVSENILPIIGIYSFSSSAMQYFVEQISADYITGLQMDTDPLFPFSATLNVYTVSVTPDYTTTVSSVELMNGINLPNIPIPAPPFSTNLKIELVSGSTIQLPLSSQPDLQTVIHDGGISTGLSGIFKVFGK